MTTRPSDIKRKKGTKNIAGTKKWDGTKWVPINVARDGQKAKLNGKAVIRKNGKWVPYTPPKRGYSPVSKTTPTKTKTKTETKPVKTTSPRSKDGSYKVLGVEYSSDSGKAWSPKDEKGRQHTAKHGYSIDPKTGKRTNRSKTSTTKPEVKSPPSRQPASRQPASSTPTRSRTPQSKDMDANYKAWAKANPTLAKKVKKGQAGYKSINSSSSTTKPPKATGAFKSGGKAEFPGNRTSTNKPKTGTNANPIKPSGSAKFPKRTGSVLKPAGRTSLKTTPAKPADKKPAKQKPLTVPTNKIPKDLTGAAGKKYLADLDAGKLTRKRK